MTNQPADRWTDTTKHDRHDSTRPKKYEKSWLLTDHYRKTIKMALMHLIDAQCLIPAFCWPSNTALEPLQKGDNFNKIYSVFGLDCKLRDLYNLKTTEELN